MLTNKCPKSNSWTLENATVNFDLQYRAQVTTINALCKYSWISVWQLFVYYILFKYNGNVVVVQRSQWTRTIVPLSQPKTQAISSKSKKRKENKNSTDAKAIRFAVDCRLVRICVQLKIHGCYVNGAHQKPDCVIFFGRQFSLCICLVFIHNKDKLMKQGKTKRHRKGSITSKALRNMPAFITNQIWKDNQDGWNTIK